MPKDYPRSLRIAELIQRELAELIRLRLHDPRVGMVTITDVDVSSDNKHAKVFFTALISQEQLADVSAGLQHAAGFLRSELARSLKLRVVPDLHFAHDPSVERGARLSKLIDDALYAGTDQVE
ncbi:MAG: 30S ribosome-binding factor RbfA [Burkholderiales bacterium]